MCSFVIISCLALVLVLLFVLLIWIICRREKLPSAPSQMPLRSIIVLGSGGHTTEMLRLLEGFVDESKYGSLLRGPRFYVLAETDKMSFGKLVELEQKFAETGKECGEFEVMKVPRSREVRQSYLTSVYTTIRATVSCIPIVLKANPDLVLVNGPGTCIPICLLAFLNRLRRRSLIVFVESICRVETLSLSALILYYGRFCDEIIVQWPQLRKNYERVTYIGRLT